MIFVTGDTHGEFSRFNMEVFPEQIDMCKDDVVIILGDFGAVWEKDKESQWEKNTLNWLEDLPFTVLFIDGNHENFDRLYTYPQKEWHGGKTHEIRPHVLHLMRGQIFNIEDKTIFTFGGARSHDISGGILELDDPDFYKKKAELDAGYAPYRINHLSWWAEELPSNKEMSEGFEILQKHNNTVDFILTHCCASSTQALLGYHDVDIATRYLEQIRQNTNFKKWIFGHYHDNININDKEILIYEQILRIA